jgi:hypothetical protein
VAAGYLPEKIPSWVARPPIAGAQKNASVDRKDVNVSVNDVKNASIDEKDAKDASDASKLARAAKSSATIEQQPPASDASVDNRLGAMIEKANANLQHPSNMIQVDGRWAVPVTTPDELPTGKYRWAVDNELRARSFVSGSRTPPPRQ